MTVGYTAPGAAYSDLYICEDQGIFKKHGLDVKLQLLNSSSQLLAAVSSNSVQVVAGVAKAPAAGILKGVDLRFISLPIPYYYMEMWGNSSITSVDAIKGKKIGLSSPGSLGDTALNALLADKGWTENDVQKTFLKSSTAAAAALEQGAVDAVVTQPPNSAQTGQHGAHKIMDFTKYPAASNAYVVTADYDKQNSDALASFVKAQSECLTMLKADKAAAVASIMKHTSSDDQQLAEYSYDFFQPLWQAVPKIDPALIEESFALAAKDSGTTPPADVTKYIDSTYTDNLG